jgi:hypothetical protein
MSALNSQLSHECHAVAPLPLCSPLNIAIRSFYTWCAGRHTGILCRLSLAQLVAHTRLNLEPKH